MSVTNATLRFREGTSAEWDAYNPVLQAGEPGLDTTLKLVKIGDGLSDWASLVPYMVGSDALTNIDPDNVVGLDEVIQDVVASFITPGTDITITYDDASGSLLIDSTATGGGGGGGLDAEAVRDAIGTALLGTGVISVTVNDPGDTITISSTATQNSSDAYLLARANHTGSQASTTISDSTATGRAVLTAATQAAARTAIGAGTSDLALGTTGTTAKAGNYAPSLADAPAGARFAAPLDGSTNTSAGMARPSARTDIFFVWLSTVQPTNMIAGDDWIIPSSTSGSNTQTALDARVLKAGDTMTGALKTAGTIHAYVAKTSSYAIVGTDYMVNCDTTSGALTVTLPTAVGRAGQVYLVRRSSAGANNVTVDTTSAQTINGSATRSLTAQYQTERYMSDGANWMLL